MTFYWFECYAGSIYNDFTREINVGNIILEEENTESLEGGKTTQIIKLALWYEDKCLENNAKIPLQINLQKSSIPECREYEKISVNKILL